MAISKSENKNTDYFDDFSLIVLLQVSDRQWIVGSDSKFIIAFISNVYRMFSIGTYM